MMDNLARLALDFDTLVTVHAPDPDVPITKASVLSALGRSESVFRSICWNKSEHLFVLVILLPCSDLINALESKTGGLSPMILRNCFR